MDYTFLADLYKEFAPPEDGILSRILHKDEKVNVTPFGFSSGQELSAHSAPTPAILYFLDGEAEVQLGEGNLRTLNDTAWLLATSSDPALRNGKEATRLAEHAVQLTSASEPALLGTLAAAYAEAGEFDKAVALEKRATELANQQGNSRLAEKLSSRIDFFQAKTPIRQR